MLITYPYLHNLSACARPEGQPFAHHIPDNKDGHGASRSARLRLGAL